MSKRKKLVATTCAVCIVLQVSSIAYAQDVVSLSRRSNNVSKFLTGSTVQLTDSKLTSGYEMFLPWNIRRAPGLAKGLISPAKTQEHADSHSSELEISGFVDASYQFENLTDENTFVMDQIEINLAKKLSERGSVRAELEWVTDHHTGDQKLQAEQGYLTFLPNPERDVTFTFGKFAPPMGFEELDAPDLYQFTHSYVFEHGGTPNLGVGAMLSAAFNEYVDLKVHVINGDELEADNNKGKSFGGRLGFTLKDHKGNFGISAVRGAENGPEGEFTTVFDVDFKFTPTEKVVVGGEINIGNEEDGASESEWAAFLLTGHAELKEHFALTVRYEYFDDKDGTRFGFGHAEKRNSITVAPIFPIQHGMEVMFEFRYDKSNENAFGGHGHGPAKDNLFRFAFEMVYSF